MKKKKEKRIKLTTGTGRILDGRWIKGGGKKKEEKKKRKEKKKKRQNDGSEYYRLY